MDSLALISIELVLPAPTIAPLVQSLHIFAHHVPSISSCRTLLVSRLVHLASSIFQVRVMLVPILARLASTLITSAPVVPLLTSLSTTLAIPNVLRTIIRMTVSVSHVYRLVHHVSPMWVASLASQTLQIRLIFTELFASLNALLVLLLILPLCFAEAVSILVKTALHKKFV